MDDGQPSLVAAAGAAEAVVQQVDLLGIFALPALATLWFLDLDELGSTWLGRPMGPRGAGLIALGYLSLLLLELSSGFDQTRAALTTRARG